MLFFIFFIRVQEDFDEFSDVEDLYSTLPMEKVEALEDMVSLAPSSLVKVSYNNLFTVILLTMLWKQLAELTVLQWRGCGC